MVQAFLTRSNCSRVASRVIQKTKRVARLSQTKQISPTFVVDLRCRGTRLALYVQANQSIVRRFPILLYSSQANPPSSFPSSTSAPLPPCRIHQRTSVLDQRRWPTAQMVFVCRRSAAQPAMLPRTFTYLGATKNRTDYLLTFLYSPALPAH